MSLVAVYVRAKAVSKCNKEPVVRPVRTVEGGSQEMY